MADFSNVVAQSGSLDDTEEAPPLIVGDSIEKTYTRGRDSSWLRSGKSRDKMTITAVDSVSLSIARGEIVGIAGPSGSGKSTLLHLLAGLELTTSGTIQFKGMDLGSLSDRQRTKYRLNNVGIVFQRFHLLPSLSARANVALPLLEQGVGKRRRRSRAESLLEDVGLGDRVQHTPDQLSGGEQQRVAIARALATDPTMIVADEPTGELDTETGCTVLDVLAKIPKEGDRSIVLASHDSQTLSICDRVIELADGQIHRVYTPTDSV